MSVSFLVGCFIYWRTLHPVKGKWKYAAAVPLAFASLKFPLIWLFGGPHLFGPELPGWSIIFSGWLYGMMMLYFLMLIVYEAVRAVTVRKFSKEKRRRVDARAHLVLLSVTSIIVSVGVYNTVPVPDIHHYKVKVPGLPPEAENLRIAVLADLHADPVTGADRIGDIVDFTMAQKPDLIAIVGDFADGDADKMAKELAPLARLSAKYGVFGVPGNHEYYSGYEKWMAEFAKLNITMLPNASRMLDCKIALAGVTDRAARRYKLERPDFKAAMKEIPEDMPVVVLCHRPDEVMKASAYKNAVLQLSGHTHGGMTPLLSWFVKRSNYGFVRGRYQVGNTTLIISNGSGIWNGFPMRLGVPAEIVVVTLVSR